MRRPKNGVRAMTSPKTALVFPTIDQTSLEEQIAARKRQVDGLEIRTRTQLMLEDREVLARRLEQEASEQRADIARLKKNIGDLQDILNQMEVAERDISVELSVVLQDIHLLRQAGVVTYE